ncbi:MAG: divalent-cation tolerance protein CutA [Elusimicrobiota bacterium]|nr:divalent-cation tolerance protein CutA [Elusimicrobiota bacterium]
MAYIVVFVTCSSKEEAEKIATKIIDLKLVACVNVIPKIHSIYWWKGNVEKSNESLLIVKTKQKLFKKLISEIKKIHSYSVPEIIALPIIDGNKDYLAWIDESTINKVV